METVAQLLETEASPLDRLRQLIPHDSDSSMSCSNLLLSLISIAGTPAYDGPSSRAAAKSLNFVHLHQCRWFEVLCSDGERFRFLVCSVSQMRGSSGERAVEF